MIQFQLLDHRTIPSQVQLLLQQLNDHLLTLAKRKHDTIRFGLLTEQDQYAFTDLLILRKMLLAKVHATDCFTVNLTDLMALIKTYLNTICS